MVYIHAFYFCILVGRVWHIIIYHCTRVATRVTAATLSHTHRY